MGRHPKFTREQLIAALEAAEGDETRAAAALGVDPTTVLRARKRHGIEIATERRIVASAG